MMFMPLFIRLTHAEAGAFHLFIRTSEIEAIIPWGDGSRVSTITSGHWFDVRETPEEVHTKIMKGYDDADS